EELNAQARELHSSVEALRSVVEGSTNGHAHEETAQLQPQKKRITASLPSKATPSIGNGKTNKPAPMPMKKEVAPQQVIPLSDDELSDF
ncbi:MAG: hypothetical protein MI919_19975, partial [Holophagales bacterium]|nr:hypothetical protein [Holophagales bacterium]